ncbi:ribonuclease H-like domain-containing protein [Planktothricoides raciborskii]|uniref:Ribonuclease D n=1 Tax=Planktothricoides raciborskii FACHB-1370 TaxID=2949576 RepID=A0ABR8EL94_9CYAN|nr:ribonuclease H-like domain-containing protein [Planktothricoides raciborskii]MBD2547418.1 ribonuclease D [Planktothricoides raciborskii FACHB-1370]MBD2583744.1 ribonuclease D [Planktothricoides raciborskii FACHB-1261]
MSLKEFQVCDGDLSADQLTEYLKAEVIAADTETMGLLPWRDRLCLVQLCDEKKRVTVVRMAKGQKSAPNLKQLLEAPNIVKVFHYARFDMAMLRYHLDIYVQPVFCSKIASKLARTYTPNHGLKSVVKELENIDLDKTSQSSDWGNAANLSDAQLKYAANDVKYLLPVQQKLTAILQREDRWKLAQDCFNCLPVFVSLDLLQYQDIFQH